MIKINYVVAFYSGERRGYQDIQTPVLKFLEKHIEYLQSNPNDVYGCTMVINSADSKVDKLLKTRIEKFNGEIDIPVKLIIRENLCGSYGAWEEAIMDSYQDYTHTFLIEDDYIPSDIDTIGLYLDKMQKTYADFVASLWRNKRADISNGLINNSIIPNTLNKFGRLFKIQSDDHYGNFGNCQITFLEYIEGLKTDICDEYHTIFFDSRKGNLVYGNEKGKCLIQPI